MSTFDLVNSPIQSINYPLFKEKGIELFIKREDLIHEYYGGNKFRKLKYHIKEYEDKKSAGIITFGGAWSNHLYSTSALCYELNIPLTVFVRGEESETESNTIQFARKNKTKIIFLSRSDYRKKNDPSFLHYLQENYKNHLIVPEGGSGKKGVLGCEEILDEKTKSYDIIITACGTGGTLAGLINSKENHQKVIGIPVLKGGEYLRDEILIHLRSQNQHDDIHLSCHYHFGGYAKTKANLIEFIKEFHETTEIRLDPIYTGKMMFGIFDMIEKGEFNRGSKILAIHSGGHQGTLGIEQRLGQKIFSE